VYVCCKNTLLSDIATDNGVSMQEVAASAHDWQQLGEALSIRTASPEGSAEAPANGQSEGSLALLQAPPGPQVATHNPATQAVTASGSFPVAADTTESTATAGVPPAMGFASPHAAPALMDSAAPEPARTAVDQSTTSVPPAMTDASLDLEEEGSGGASEALAAGAPSGKGSEAAALATVGQAEPTTGTEGKAAPNSPSDLSVVDADTTTTTAGGKLPSAEVAADTDQAAAQATTDVAPAVTDADCGEEEAGGASEALAAGAPSGKGSVATASATIDDAEPRTGTEGKAAPDSPPDLSVVDAEHSTHAAEGFNEDKAAADSPGSEVWATIPKQVPATESPTASASLLTAAAADTTAEAKSGTDKAADQATTGTDKAAAQATTGTDKAAAQATTGTDKAAAQATTGTDKAADQPIIGVPPAVIDASVDHEEEEAGGAYEALRAGAPLGKGSEATASATISEPEPRTGTEGKAAPDSPSDLSVVDAERATHVAEGFSDNRAAADSPGADVWATTPLAKFKIRTTSRDPAAESEADTIAAKHAAEPALTMLEDLLGSSSPQAYSKGQSAENKAAAQPASTAAAVATSSPAAQNDVKSFPTPTPTAAATAGSADADVATSASAVSTSGGDDNLTALRSAPPRLDKVHPPGSAVHTPDSANVTAKSEAGVSASDLAAAKPAVLTATGTDATAGVCNSPVQTAVQASLPTTTKSVSSALPVDESEGISAEAEPAVREAASSAVPASADHAAADAQGPVQSSTTSKSGSGSKGVTKWVVHPGDHRLEWPENPVERKLSSGGTAVVLR